jgi:thiamine biosynthesis lipoprotein
VKKAGGFTRVAIPLIIIVFLTLFMLPALHGCIVPLQRFEDTRDKMGTYVSIVIYSHDEDARKLIDGGYNNIDELSKIASNYDPDSSVSKLNQQGSLDNSPSELVEMMNLSVEYNKITKGAFDITVDPVLTLWSEGLWKESEEIQQQKLDEALKLVDSGMIEVEDNNISFKKEGMSVTLGGVAKGYIVDKVLEYLEANGVKNAMVNAGGDIATLGKKANGEKWIISLENPDNTAEKIATFAVADEAVTTSGNYYRYFDPEKEAHHIIDPRTGYSANECISVTIITENATIADVLSTSVFVLGPVEGMALVEDLDKTEALIIDSESNITMSSGLDKYLVK